MERFLWITFGGALGTGARYLVAVWAGQRFGTAFPYGTLIVNLAGCFIMGFLMELATSVAAFPVTLRLALSVGFLGGLTTYSSFNFETTKLFRDGTLALALWNVGITAFGGFLAGVLGLALARYVAG